MKKSLPLILMGIVVILAGGVLLWILFPQETATGPVLWIDDRYPMPTADGAVNHETSLLETGADRAGNGGSAGPENGEGEAEGEVVETDAEFNENILAKAIESMLQEMPDKEDAAVNAGVEGMGRGRPWRRVLPQERDESLHLLNQSRAAIDNGDYGRALELLAKSLETDPTNRQAYRSLAQLQRNLGLPEAELETLREWMDAMPGDALPHYELAAAHARQGQYDEAVASLRQFQEISQGSGSSYPMAASLYRRLGMHDEEGAALMAWSAADPDAADAYRALGDYYRRNGDFASAIAEYQQVLDIQPGNYEAHVNMANAYSRMGQYPEAVSQYMSAIDLRPGDLGARRQLADTYRRIGDFPAAIDAYQSIIDIQPGSRQARLADRQITRIERQWQRQP
jgi:tetratricopeptide (TPR) repeat protein